MCEPVVLQCFSKSGAVVGVDVSTAHLHILQASRKVTHIYFYSSCAEQQTNVCMTQTVTRILVTMIRNYTSNQYIFEYKTVSSTLFSQRDSYLYNSKLFITSFQ